MTAAATHRLRLTWCSKAPKILSPAPVPVANKATLLHLLVQKPSNLPSWPSMRHWQCAGPAPGAERRPVTGNGPGLQTTTNKNNNKLSPQAPPQVVNNNNNSNNSSKQQQQTTTNKTPHNQTNNVRAGSTPAVCCRPDAAKSEHNQAARQSQAPTVQRTAKGGIGNSLRRRSHWQDGGNEACLGRFHGGQREVP